MEEHIVVTGGSGFVGRAICKLLNEREIPAVSISRKGVPDGFTESDYPFVKWVAADVFDTSTWKQYLDNCIAIIHCIGIIDENPEQGITYEKYILQSAKIVGDAAKSAGINAFVYISAGAGAPETPAAYMENKLAAEEYLASLSLGLVVLKPGMIYGTDKPETISENEQMQQMLLDPQIAPHIRPNRPLAVETIARVAVAAALTEVRDNILNVDGIEEADYLLKAQNL